MNKQTNTKTHETQRVSVPQNPKRIFRESKIFGASKSRDFKGQELMQILIVGLFVFGFFLVQFEFTGMGGYEINPVGSLEVNLVWPKNNTNLSYSGLSLTYTVSDAINNLLLCSLFINNEINTSNSSAITKDVNQSFNLSFAPFSSYLWNVQCENDAGELVNSSQYNFTVQTCGTISSDVKFLITYILIT